MKLLGASRLSRKTDTSTSIERQREQITLTAKVRGDELIHITEDSDVSGSVSPFLRADLGPWLTDPDKIASYSGIICAKVDRLTRSLSDFDEIVKWCDAHNKTLISVSENIDLSTSTGRLLANLLAMFAQWERERMSERRKEAAVKIRDNGWWAGFGRPYGTKPVKVNDHYELEIDPVTYAQLEKIAEQIIAGHSASSIAKRLNANDVPTPANGKMWRQNTIRDMFTNPKCVLESDLLAQVTDALDTSKQGWTKRGDAAMLLNIAHCVCGAQLYSKRYTSKGRLYSYYDCSAKCGARRIPMADLEHAVSAHCEQLTGVVFRKVTAKGKSTKSLLNTIERRIRSLDLDDEQTRSELMAERKTLLENALRGAYSDSVTYVELDTSVGDYWASLDETERRQFLLVSGVKAIGCQRTASGVAVEVTSPEHEYLAL